MLEILCKVLELNPEIYTLQIKYIFEVGCIPINVFNYRGIKFYLKLKKNEPDKTKFPFRVDIISESMSSPNEQTSVEVSRYRVPPHQIGLQCPCLAPDYHEMPPLEDLHLEPVEPRVEENPPVSFATERDGDCLDNQS